MDKSFRVASNRGEKWAVTKGGVEFLFLIMGEVRKCVYSRK